MFCITILTNTGSSLVTDLLKDSSAAVHLLLLPCPEAAEVRHENRRDGDSRC